MIERGDQSTCLAVSAEAAPLLPEEEEEDIKLYTIHISSKYLNLTRQKLQLTRLPHDVPQPRRNEWWEPKSTVEPLVDHWYVLSRSLIWMTSRALYLIKLPRLLILLPRVGTSCRLEHFSWREQEAAFNANVPQFRTAIRTASSEPPVRLHFIHSRSTHACAVPCLLIPPFPFTNLSLSHIINVFTTPDDPSTDLSFHVVIPSLPGLGFSDSISSNRPMLPLVAQMFDTLMKRLGYQHYLASTTTPSPNPVTDVDFRLINHIAFSYPDSCLGIHLLSPPFEAPTWQWSPLEWLRWKTAATLQTPCLGYTQHDITAFRQQARRLAEQKQLPLVPGMGFEMNKRLEPNTLAYALCDSPTGVLLFILMVLRTLAPKHEFSNDDVIRLAGLTWLPGPERTIRLWADCSSSIDDLPSSSLKPKAGITTYTEVNETSGVSQQQSDLPLPFSGPDVHTCLAWGKSRFNIVSSQTITGSPGLLAWERPEAIAAGVRGLAKAIIARDDRLQIVKEPAATLLEQVVVGGEIHQLLPTGLSGATIQ
ncbi:hypothetical protein E4U41_005929 [Claviceps citrina]|nr:hypothetical protein E4U41_005929 [Claviceps citrina]